MPDEPQPEPVDAEVVELSPAPGSTAQPAEAFHLIFEGALGIGLP